MMKKLLFLSVLFALLSASRCEKQETFELGVPFEMAPGQTFQRAGGDLTITFNGISEDSRCPRGVSCVWAGQAIARFRLEADTSREIQLVMQDGQPRLAVTEALGHVFTLQEVNPYPESGKKIGEGEYRVVVKVDKP